MQEVEICRFCKVEPVTPKGKKIFEGRLVEMVSCKKCGIRFVSSKDLPLLENTFKCADRSCNQNSGGWCQLESPCERFIKP